MGQEADVIKAAGGTNLSIDSVNVQNGGYTTLDTLTIRETASGQLEEGLSLVLELPNGFEWNPDLQHIDNGGTIGIIITPTGGNNTELEVEFNANSSNASQVVIDVTSESRTTGGGRGKGPGRVEISGLQLKPTTLDVPTIGQISNTGGTGPDKNYGDLSTAVGAIQEIIVESAADGSGQQISSQDILAGEPITGYAIGRDVGDNFVENIGLNDESDWNLINITGNVPQTALTPSADLKNATFSSQKTGTAQIQANYSNVSLTPSETITVLPRAADEMVINTQPSGTATAGDPFPTQPVIYLQDQFGNKVTTDNSTEVTVSISSGNGSLSGTLTQTASNGEITFTDLFATVAETITLQFENPEFSTVTSDQITINPASPSDLTYTQQPSNTAQGSNIDPAVELQLLDEFENIVTNSGTQVTINDESFLDSGTSDFTSDTDSDGIATFDGLNIASGASKGSVNLTAQFSGISSPVSSESFLIIAADELARFIITDTNGNDIGEQQAGSSFNITVTAKDGSKSDYTFSSDRTVEITSDGDIQKNGSSTSSFQITIPSGESSLNTDLTITSSGDTKIFADEGQDVSGTSNTFNVTPSSTIDETQSTITANPTLITADGNSTSTITVQLKDEFGNNLVSGGETVELTTTAGTFNGGVTTITANDEGDGTYTAVLISSTTAGETATISATVNSNDITDEATVNFEPGEVTSFTIALPQSNGSPATQTAGAPFEIDVHAVDDLGNTVTSFNGPVTFTSNSAISAGETATFSNGTLENYPITLTTAGANVTITVSGDNLYQVSGTSTSFEIVANQPDASTSQVTASPDILLSDGDSQSVITVTLRDEFQNQVFQQKAVSLNIAQLEENDGVSPDGDADATFTNGQQSISNLPFNSNQGIYRDTLTSTNTIELVEITGSFGSSPSTGISQTPTVDIVIPNTWEPGGGPSEFRSDWNNDDNWTSGVPDEDDYVVIPDNSDPVPELDLNVTLGSFQIGTGNSLTLYGGNAITVSGNLDLQGDLNIEENTELNVNGNLIGGGTFAGQSGTNIEVKGDISLTNFNTRTTGSEITLNGSDPQVITTPIFRAQSLNILNDVTATSGDLIDTANLLITEGNTFELAQDAGITLDNLENISGDGELILNNNTLVTRGDLSLLNIDTSEGTVIFGIRTDENFADYPDLEQQQIANLSEMQNAVINNTEGVRTFEDIIIEGDLTLENGELIISSGKSLIAPNQTYNNGSITIRRSISNNGWVMMGSPINVTFSDLFDGLVTQGMTNSDYPDKQPNLLYYYESAECTQDGDTVPCTDNQRWRTPDDINNNIHSSNTDSLGQGYFFYVFGDVDGDSDYNDSLPKTLSVSGEEYQQQSSTFDFTSVSYTASADTIESMVGWNLLSNPWAASLDWDDSEWTKTNVDNVIYIWDPSTNSYKTWNGIDGSLDNGLIKPFQAFWVKANGTNPNLTVDKSVKTTGGTYYGKSKKEPASIGFKLEADTLETETHITLTPDGSNAKDPRDAYRLLPFETETYLELYTTFDDGTELSINNLARSFGKEISIPMHVGGFNDGQPINGEYTLSWPTFGDVPDEWTIILQDKKTGEKINLRKNTFYSFNLSQSKAKSPISNTTENFQLVKNQRLDTKAKSQNKSNSDENRFVIHISPGADGADVPDEYSLGKNYPNPFSEQTTIEYNTPVEGEVQIHIYDILGRKVKTILNERRPADYHEIDWIPSQLASGVYIVVMRAGGKQFSKKLTYIK
ncbi:invasin domain 3-containing protein [Fodinibius sp. Rm-B-1B1-1]|uniref:invasin domain 3-containing protein n=1 Tax=Fodinibius alkaliphilus TaxID=3140241 RepID=UPI00315A296B